MNRVFQRLKSDLWSILIHGTFARNAEWTRPRSFLRNSLYSQFKQELKIEAFEWSGDNSLTGRAQAADALRNHLRRTLVKYPNARQYVIAHSHGGNVALQAVAAPELNRIRIACLSTPFFAIRERNWGDLVFNSMGAAVLIAVALASYVLSVVPIPISVGVMIVPIVVYMLSRLVQAGLHRLTGRAAQLRGIMTVDTEPLKGRLYILRSPADEAATTLVGLQFIGWVATAAARVVNAAVATPQRMIGAFILVLGPPAAVALNFLLRYAVEHRADTVSLIVFALTVRLTEVPNAVYFGRIALTLLAMPFVLLTASMLAVLTMLTMAAWFIGPELLLVGTILDVTVEPMPAGIWTIHQLELSEVGGFQHSRSYEDPRAVASLVEWIKTAGL